MKVVQMVAMATAHIGAVLKIPLANAPLMLLVPLKVIALTLMRTIRKGIAVMDTQIQVHVLHWVVVGSQYLII